MTMKSDRTRKAARPQGPVGGEYWRYLGRMAGDGFRNGDVLLVEMTYVSDGIRKVLVRAHPRGKRDRDTRVLGTREFVLADFYATFQPVPSVEAAGIRARETARILDEAATLRRRMAARAARRGAALAAECRAALATPGRRGAAHKLQQLHDGIRAEQERIASDMRRIRSRIEDFVDHVREEGSAAAARFDEMLFRLRSGLAAGKRGQKRVQR